MILAERRGSARVISSVWSTATAIILLPRSSRPSILARRSSEIWIRILWGESSSPLVGRTGRQLAWSPRRGSWRLGREWSLFWRRCLSLYRRVLNLFTASRLCASLAFGCRQLRPAICQAVHLAFAEAGQDGKVALCVLVVDLHHTTDEELLLFGSTSLPIIRLRDGDHEALLAGPLLLLLFVLGLRLQVCEVLDGCEILHGPRLANREGAIGVLASLVQLHSARVSHRDHDDAPLLVRRRGGGRGRRLRVDRVLLDADVGDVGFLQLALVVGLGEAALGDAAALVVEALGARHARRGGARAGCGRRAPWPSRRWASARRSRVSQAVGVVVARPAVHLGDCAGTLHGSPRSIVRTVRPNSSASAAVRKRAIP